MIEFLFLDLDDTILDFHKAERLALGKTFRSFGLEPTEEVLTRYHLINKAHWERLERKELTREEVLVGRFAALFQEFGLQVDPEACARAYENNLSIGHYFLPGAYEAVESLSKKYKLYLASNGTAKVQAGRLNSANISHYFQKIFVSQEIGANKPDILYFQRCFAEIPGFDVTKAMMVGDSLTSDILGGIQAGMKTCWVNPNGKVAPENIQPDYEIKALSELEGLLDSLL
ncbi:MAG: YjjG family noncanonical pyrimidine nucleotidase [Oscillospiraceae bacterium]|nr:YjjG family noncanonical pyrimidine nucleotidase [Oscillospiraceae bacterium]